MSNKPEYSCVRCKDKGEFLYGGFTYKCECNPDKAPDLFDFNIKGIWITLIIMSLVTLMIQRLIC